MLKRRSPGMAGKNEYVGGFRGDSEAQTPLLSAGKAAIGGASILSCVATLANTILGTGILELSHAFSATGLVVGVVLLCFFACCAAFTLHLLAESARTVTGVDPNTGARLDSSFSLDHTAAFVPPGSTRSQDLLYRSSGASSPVYSDQDRLTLADPSQPLPDELKPQKSSFYLVADAAVPRFSFLVDTAVAVKCFGVAVSYLIVVGDMMPDAMKFILGDDGPPFWLSRQTWIVAGWLLVVPMAFAKTLDALKFTSSFAVAVVMGVVAMTILYAVDPDLDGCDDADDDGCPGETVVIPDSPKDTFAVLTLFVFCFTCHQNIFTICNEIKRNTRKNVNRVIFIAVSMCFSLCLLVAIAGYSMYGDVLLPEGKDNILPHMPSNEATTAARIGLTLMVLFSYPLQAHPSRNSALSLVNSCFGIETDAAAGPQVDLRFIAFTVVFLIASLAIALVTESLGMVMGIVGAVGSTTVSFLLPGAVYFRLHPWPHWKRYGAAFVFCIGCIIMPLALVFIFL
mmetsp:Transcript_14415/g.43297  ORF Transcript_14415/g.43297 Transcript_14415/m.43297 type:complete len:512 (+) Transcript_14415:219-1754(+)